MEIIIPFGDERKIIQIDLPPGNVIIAVVYEVNYAKPEQKSFNHPKLGGSCW